MFDVSADTLSLLVFGIGIVLLLVVVSSGVQIALVIRREGFKKLFDRHGVGMVSDAILAISQFVIVFGAIASFESVELNKQQLKHQQEQAGITKTVNFEYNIWTAQLLKEDNIVNLDIHGEKPAQVLDLKCWKVRINRILIDTTTRVVQDPLSPNTQYVNYSCNGYSHSKNNNIYTIHLTNIESELRRKYRNIDKYNDSKSKLHGYFVQLWYWHSANRKERYRVEGAITWDENHKKPVRLTDCGWEALQTDVTAGCTEVKL